MKKDDPATIKLFDDLFGTSAATRSETVPKVIDIIKQTQKHVEDMVKPEWHRCGTQCDGGCAGGATAYNSDRDGPGTKGVMTLCDALDEMPEKARPVLIIHEGHHGTPKIPSRDFAYNYERLITKLDTETALKTASTISVLGLN